MACACIASIRDRRPTFDWSSSTTAADSPPILAADSSSSRSLSNLSRAESLMSYSERPCRIPRYIARIDANTSQTIRPKPQTTAPKSTINMPIGNCQATSPRLAREKTPKPDLIINSPTRRTMPAPVLAIGENIPPSSCPCPERILLWCLTCRCKFASCSGVRCTPPESLAWELSPAPRLLSELFTQPTLGDTCCNSKRLHQPPGHSLRASAYDHGHSLMQ